MKERDVDVLVVGGGPAGSTTAALLAKAGFKVMLLERDHFPRYHIGESLLPSCLPVLKLSGAFDAVAAHGFTLKRGGLWHWADDVWVLDWEKLVDPDASSWQVDRAEYDEILLRNATKQGAEVIEGVLVRSIEFDGDRPIAAQVGRVKDLADTWRVKFRYLVDATGRSGLLAQQHFQIRRPHDTFQNIAIWGYWTDAKLLPQSPQGAINVVSAPNGWWWSIPLAGNRTSIGLVLHRSRFLDEKKKHGSLEEFYASCVQGNALMRQITEGATYTSPVRVEQDYSYVADRFCGPNYRMVGDSACFLDPLLSTGVHLAHFSATLAAASIASAIRGEVTEDDARSYFEHTFRRAYIRLLVLVSRLYEDYRGKDEYFRSSERLVDDGARWGDPARTFTTITAGMTDISELSRSDTEELNRKLVAEAQESQRARARSYPKEDRQSLDVTPAWGTWRSLDVNETRANGLQLVTSPHIGLARVNEAPAQSTCPTQDARTRPEHDHGQQSVA